MAYSYPTSFPFSVDDERQVPGNVYPQSYPYDYYDDRHTPERTDSPMERTAEYISGLNPNIDALEEDDHFHQTPHHHHHRHSSHPLRPLTIRRHTPGSNDPLLQNRPSNLQTSLNNTSSSSNVRVTIKRNPIIIDQPVIQPLLYPVNVYVTTPIPQYPQNQPIQLIQEIPKPPSPMKQITKPPSPKKPITPIKKSPTPPPTSPDRYETESFHLPPTRNKNKNVTPRRPVRTDLITPAQSNQFLVKDYDETKQVSNIHAVPKKVISYRTVPGMTTREAENDKMDYSGGPIYVRTPPIQTITYRTS